MPQADADAIVSYASAFKFRNEKSPPLVFVWLGDKFPAWLSAALAMNNKLCGISTILISSKSAGRLSSVTQQIFIEDFYEPPHELNVQMGKSNPKFRGGFWIKTSERFFVLEQFMDKFSCPALFHAELDNLIFDVSTLAAKLDLVGQGFFCPRDAIDRGIASLIYINEIGALRAMLLLLSQSSTPFANDMALLGHMLQTSPQFYALPTENAFNKGTPPSWVALGADEVAGIFDAAALGQFLFGIDPKNSGVFLFNFFENENKGCNLSRLQFNPKFENRQFSISNREHDLTFNVYNLHIHSKQFIQLQDQRRFNAVLNQANKGEKSLIAINVLQNRLFRSIQSRLTR
jgi:hypothetical protein